MTTNTTKIAGEDMTDEQIEKLKLIERCDPSWLIQHIEDDTAYDGALVEQVFVLAKDRARALLASKAAVPQTLSDGAQYFACYLIDNCENEVIREESVQAWLGKMLASPRYHPTAPAQSSGDAEQADEAVTDDVFDWLETEVTAISCRYHGDPSYDHDAYWMRDRVVKLIGEARNVFAARAKDSK